MRIFPQSPSQPSAAGPKTCRIEKLLSNSVTTGAPCSPCPPCLSVAHPETRLLRRKDDTQKERRLPNHVLPLSPFSPFPVPYTRDPQSEPGDSTFVPIPRGTSGKTPDKKCPNSRGIIAFTLTRSRRPPRNLGKTPCVVMEKLVKPERYGIFPAQKPAVFPVHESEHSRDRKPTIAALESWGNPR
jgi:hypothetical protein